MAVDKNFVVKHGLEVNSDLFLADASRKRVGVATTVPGYTLDVAGGIGVTHLSVTGIGTVVDLHVGSGGRVFRAIGAAGSVGIGTALPGYLLDVRSTADVGITALNIRGDVQITGNININDIFVNQTTTNHINVSTAATVENFYIPITGIATIGVGIVTSLTGYDIGYSIGTITTLNGTSGTIVNITGTSGTVTNIVSTSSTIRNLTGTSSTITNIVGTSATITNIRSVSGIITNVVSTSSTTINIIGTSGTVTNITGTSGTITRVSVSNITGTSGTITNITGTSGTITNITGSTGNITNITGTSGNITNVTLTNVTGTLGTITNVRSTTLTGTSATFTQLNVIGVSSLPTISIQNGTVNVLSTTNATISNNLVVSGISTLNVIGVSGVTTSRHLQVVGFTTLGNSTISGVATISNSNITNLVGTFSTVSQQRVTGTSTLLSTTLVGSSSSTGTPSQILQVNGGSYISGSVGVGKTLPTFNLDVVGTINATGGFYLNGVLLGETTYSSIAGVATYASSAGISTTATNANNINISATTSADTTTSVVLVANQATGNQSPFIDSGLIYNANTNSLSATTFSGNATGLTGTPSISVATITSGNINSGNINSSGIITATSFIDDGTDLLAEINTKVTPGKSIAMAMIFG